MGTIRQNCTISSVLICLRPARSLAMATGCGYGLPKVGLKAALLTWQVWHASPLVLSLGSFQRRSPSLRSSARRASASFVPLGRVTSLRSTFAPAAQGFLAPQGFFAAHGFLAAQGFLAAHGFLAWAVCSGAPGSIPWGAPARARDAAPPTASMRFTAFIQLSFVRRRPEPPNRVGSGPRPPSWLLLRVRL